MIERLDILAAVASLLIAHGKNTPAYPAQVEDIGPLIDINWEGWSDLSDALEDLEREGLVYSEERSHEFTSLRSVWGITPAGLVKVLCR